MRLLRLALASWAVASVASCSTALPPAAPTAFQVAVKPTERGCVLQGQGEVQDDDRLEPGFRFSVQVRSNNQGGYVGTVTVGDKLNQEHFELHEITSVECGDGNAVVTGNLVSGRIPFTFVFTITEVQEETRVVYDVSYRAFNDDYDIEHAGRMTSGKIDITPETAAP